MVILDSQIWKVAFADRSRSFGFLTPVRGIPLVQFAALLLTTDWYCSNVLRRGSNEICLEETKNSRFWTLWRCLLLVSWQEQVHLAECLCCQGDQEFVQAIASTRTFVGPDTNRDGESLSTERLAAPWCYESHCR